MKKYTFLWLLLIGLSGLLFSCSDDDEVTGPLTIKTALLKKVAYNTAVCGGEITGGESIGNRGVCWSVNPQPTIQDTHTADGSGRGEYLSEMTGLEEGTLYYVRAYAETGEGIKYGDEKYCMTLAHGRPTLLLIGVSEVKETTAVLSAEVFTDGGQEITERGVVYMKKTDDSEEPTLENAKKLAVEGTTGLLRAELNELMDQETYVYRAYVKYAEGTIYTRTASFTTLAYPAPEMTLSEAAEVTNVSFKVTLQVVAGSPLPVLEYGLVWSTKTGPTVEDNRKKIGEGEGETETTIEGLDEGIGYYVRPYAVNKNGTYYGKEEQVTTLSYKAAIATRMTKYITAHRAYISGEILNFGVMNAPVSEAGICYGTKEHPTVDDRKVLAAGIGNDRPKFDSLMIFPLKPETKYYVRAYVTNEYGTNYGDEYSFTTREPVSDYFKAEGSSGDNPVFNGLNMTATYPNGLRPSDQQEAYEKLDQIMTAYGKRILTAYRIYLMADAQKNPRYIYTTIQYKNSANKAYVGTWRAKLDQDEEGVYRVSYHEMNGGNATNIYNSAVKNGQLADLERSMNYLNEGPFVIDWDTESSTTLTKDGKDSAFYIIPLDHPEKLKRMGVFRYTSVSTTTDWW